MTAFINHFLFEFKTGLRNPMMFFMNYLFPLGFYAMMGGIMTQVNPMFSDTLIPAMVIFTILAGALLGLPSPLVESRESGIYRSFKVNGVPAASILSIPVLTTIFHVLIAATVVALSGGPLFAGLVPQNWWAFALLTIVTAFSCASLGALIGVVAADSRATILLSQLLFLPSMLIGGLMMPLEVLPQTMQPFSALLPSTHAMQAILGLAYGQTTLIDPLVSLGVLLSSGLLAFGLAIYLFNWDSHNEARRGHPLLSLLALLPYALSILLMNA